MRSPRSAPRCGATCSGTSARVSTGAIVRVTVAGSPSSQRVISRAPTALAVASARAIKFACRRAAPMSPSSGIRRVLHALATGARANTASARSANITITAGQVVRIGAKKVRKPQAPHQKNRAPNTLLLPTPGRRDHACGQYQRRRQVACPPAELDVLHQRNRRESLQREKGATGDEDGLVAAGDAG